MSALGAVEQMLLLRRGSLIGAGIGVRVWDLRGFTVLADDVLEPVVEEGGRGGGQEHVAGG